MTGNRKEHLWKEKIMKIRKTICSLLLVCLAFLGIFCGRANVYADQKQALSATVTLLKQEKDCVVQVEAKNSGGGFYREGASGVFRYRQLQRLRI